MTEISNPVWFRCMFSFNSKCFLTFIGKWCISVCSFHFIRRVYFLVYEKTWLTEVVVPPPPPKTNMNSSNVLSYLILTTRRFYPWKNKFERVMQSDGQEKWLWQKKWRTIEMRWNYCIKWNYSEMTQSHDIVEQEARNGKHHSQCSSGFVKIRIASKMFYLTTH